MGFVSFFLGVFYEKNKNEHIVFFENIRELAVRVYGKAFGME
jgi:hypothetical protein